jgi:hypothetical protein
LNTCTVSDEEVISLRSSVYSLLHSLVTSSLIGPHIFLITLFVHTLSGCTSLSMRDQVSHPYKTTGKFTFTYFFIFVFLDSKLEDKRFHTEI